MLIFQLCAFQSRAYNFVSRCGKFFAGEPHWVYWCTCNEMDSRLKDSLSSSSIMEYTDASSLFPKCIHVLAVKQIVESLDAVHGIAVESDLSGKCLHYVDGMGLAICDFILN